MTRTTTDLDQPELLAILERARTLGFLGPGPLRDHLQHALRYRTAIASIAGARTLSPAIQGRLDVLDLGSGAGLPGLPLALWLPDCHLALLDSGQRRCDFLRMAVSDLRLEDRVSVAEGRAEKLAHLVGMRARYDVVVSRGFGPPALTVECGLGFVKDGGVLLVSEPPSRRPWADLSLRGVDLRYSPEYIGLAALTVVGDTTATPYPRNIKSMRREPLFALE
ncbi:MAG: class I SAM-dependent methyltransferase [Actinomycetota bacterium]|nr:class I SAM-dependent methyltransferase [Actinomycetota bacterium]